MSETTISEPWRCSLAELVTMRSRRMELTVVRYTSAMAQMPWLMTLRVLSHMHGNQCPSNCITLNSVLAAATRSARWAFGFGLLQDMKTGGVVPSIVSFGTGITLSRAFRWHQGFLLLQQLPKRSLQPNTVTSNAALSCVAAASASTTGDAGNAAHGWMAAMDTYSHMHQLGIEIGAATTGSLIHLARFLRRWHLAFEFLTLEKQLHCDAHKRREHRSVSRISFNSAISACEGSSQWDAALGICESMERSIDGVTVSACISACEKGQRWVRAVDLARHLPQIRILPKPTRGDLQCRAMALAACISACEKGLEWQRSLQTAFDLRPFLDTQKASKTLPYNAALCSLGRSVRWELALGILRWLPMSTLRPSLESLNACLGALRTAQEWSKAMSAWLTLEQSALMPSVVTMAASAAIISGRAACNALISACAEPLRWRKAICLFDETMDPDRISFNSLASALEKSRLWVLTLGLLPQLRVRLLEPDPFTKEAIFSAAERARAWRQVLANLRTGSSQPPGAAIMGIVFSALSSAGQMELWPKALQLLQDLKDSEVEADASVLGTVAELFVEAGGRAVQRAPYIHSLHLLERMQRGTEAWLSASGLRVIAL
ncbi:LPE1 [Symbiodinium sp. CCMP2592]|nr:LPE1 [Symbiodinium sp. CCMP2592]